MLNLLLLEDFETDATLILRTLKNAGISFKPVIAKGKSDYLEAIHGSKFDVILADNSMPQFSAMEALELYNERNLGIPFILVTGSISEEFAVEIMKQGACDYILKDRLQRLPNAVMNAVQKCRLEADRKKYYDEVIASQALLKEAARLAHFGSWEADLLNYVQRWSDEQYNILGYEPGEIEPSINNFLKSVYLEDLNFVKEILDNSFQRSDRQTYKCRIVNKQGVIKYIYGEMAVKRDETGKAIRINGFIRDVSETMLAEMKEKMVTEDLIQRNKDLEQFAYIISHNLRAPVANIVGISDILIEENLVERDRGEFMQSLSVSAKKLDTTIIDLNHILQVKQHVNENKEKVQFSNIVDDIKISIGRFIDENKINIVTDFDEVDAMPTLKSYMHSIFFNLISNSIKFRHADLAAVIEIKSYKLNDKIVLTFKDNGIGIDMEKKGSYLFGMYKRFHPEHAEGKGIGLYMVKTQVETLGGNISVKSKVNEGTEFTIVFKMYDLHA